MRRRDQSRRRARAWTTVLPGLIIATAVVGASIPPAAAVGPLPALIAPDDPATGDPAPPDGSPVPEGLDEPAPVPDESVVDDLPTDPAVVPDANTLKIAWVGTPAERPADPAQLLTLQAALTAAGAGATVSFDPDDYAFTSTLTVPRPVTLDTSAASVLYARFTVSGGGLAFADDVSIGAPGTGAAVTVTATGAALQGVTIRNPNGVLRPTGIQLGAGVTGVTIAGFTMDGGGQASSYGVNLTTGSAVITDPQIAGVATGVTVTAAAAPSAIAISGGHITATTSGVSLGTAIAPQVTDLHVTGPDAVGTGIDLANSSAAAIDGVTVENFSRGIGTSTTNASSGPTISDATIQGASREGIALGATASPSVVRPQITGDSLNQSTGILVLRSTDATIDHPAVTGMMYGITTHLDNTGAGPEIVSPQITAFGGITLGSTQGARVTDAVVDAGDWGPSGTGINLVNAGHVTITAARATGFLYAIGSQSSMPPGADRSGIVITGVTAVGAPNASSGVYLLGAVDATVSDVDADITGAALVIHQSDGVSATDIVVHGHQGLTSTTGSAILRAYGSQNVDVDRSSIDAGSYGFFYSATDGSTITNATVANVVERGLYGRSVADLDVSASTFTANGAVGLLVVTDPANGISHDIAIHDNTMTGNGGGIDVLQGTTAVQIERNTVSGQPGFVTAGGAHDLLIDGNAVDQAGDAVAIRIAPLWQDGALDGSYSSSGVVVRGNVFSGAGTWVAVGTPDLESEQAERRTLRDTVLVTGNVFPAASIAVQTYPNAVEGVDAAGAGARALPIDGPIAVDARDYDDPNDWGSACRATGTLDEELYYDGGGAGVVELTEAPVLYPMPCIDLSLVQDPAVGGDPAYEEGATITWTLTPHNAGPRPAPAGWSIVQLLDDRLEIVSIEGAGYTVEGDTATADDDLPAGADGPALTITARVTAVPEGATSLRDVAYVVPAPDDDFDGDGFADGIFEWISPLEVPTIDTDTTASATDNDAQGVWAVAAPVDGGDDGSGTSDGEGGDLAVTGADVAGAGLLAAALLGAGALVLGARASRRRRDGLG